MSQQGGRPTGHEDDWWGQLYDSTDDTGPAPAPDTLDDRFASATGAVGDAVPRQGRGGSAGDRTDRDSGHAEDGGFGSGAGAGGEPSVSGAGPGDGLPGRAAGPGDGLPGRAAGPGDGLPGRAAGPGDGQPRRDPRPGADGPGSGARGGEEQDPRAGAPVPAPRTGAPDATAPSFDGPAAGERPPDASAAWEPTSDGPAAWEPPPDAPTSFPPGPGHNAASFPSGANPPAPYPPGPKPPGFVERVPEERSPSPSGGRASAEGPAASRMPGEPSPPQVPPRPAAPPHDAGRPGSPPASSERGAAGTRHGRGDWWAAPPAPDAGGNREAPAGPGSTQPNPTPGPSGRAEETAPQAPRTATRLDLPTLPPAPVGFVGSGPPTYDAEPTALPTADPDELDDLVADTVLDGARYGACTLRAVSVRGDSARFRGEPRRDSLLTARFGTGDQALILVAMATGARATPGAHRAAAEACHWIGRAVGRSHARLAQDIGAARRGDLKSGLHRLTDRSLGKLRASAVEQGVDPEEYAASLRCLLLPADPDCRIRVFFGIGPGGLFRLRDGEWHDIEPRVTEVTGEPVVGFGSLPSETPDGDRLTMDLGIPTPPSPYEPAPEPPREPFRFRASVARPGDALLMCTGGLADPLRGEPELCAYLTGRWSGPTPPGLAEFLADSQVRVKGYADDRTAAAVWEA
ncbi:protein phosphatase 2C domain-containing protein [Streptomyces caeruleatus]